jgi:hypothetical protein
MGINVNAPNLDPDFVPNGNPIQFHFIISKGDGCFHECHQVFTDGSQYLQGMNSQGALWVRKKKCGLVLQSLSHVCNRATLRFWLRPLVCRVWVSSRRFIVQSSHHSRSNKFPPAVWDRL